MINTLVAYDIQEVKNKYSLTKITSWFQGGLIDEAQWEASKVRYKTNLFMPSFFMRILLFIATILGISTILGPLVLIFDIDNEVAVRIMLVLVGLVSVLFIEFKMIKGNHHFKSGVTEAGYYIGLLFIYFGVLSFDEFDEKVYVSIAFLTFLAASIRYLDLVCLAAAVCSFVFLIFLFFHAMLSMIPFLMIGVFLGLFFGSRILHQRADTLLWENHFTLFDTLALLLIYLAGNYFVVREMSMGMMGFDLVEGEDIPFAFLFYTLTFLIPVLYLAIGVIKKQTLLIRVGVLAILLSVVTIKYYYSIGYPEVAVTLAGGALILISLSLMKYLKQKPKRLHA